MRLPRWGRRRWLLTALAAAPLLGFAGVVIAELVPDGRIAAQLASALDRGELGIDDRSTSLLGTTADHYAECTAVMVGLGDPPRNLFYRAMISSTAYGCPEAFDELAEFAATGTLGHQPSYLRYWHGYAPITRPALAIFGLSGTRWLAFAALAAAFTGCVRAVARRCGAAPAALLVAPVLLTTDQIAGGWSIAQAVGLATTWLGAWIVVLAVGREPHWEIAALAAALAGAIAAYLDLMVSLPASLILASVAAGLAVQRRGDPTTWRPTAASMLAAAGGWGVGLAAMWASKWVLAWVFVGSRVWSDVRRSISFRVGGEHGDVTGTRITGFTKNVEYWWDRPLTPIVVAVGLAVLAALAWRRRAVGRADARGWAVVGGCLVIAVVPFVAWYVVLNNHTQIHAWLTYRSVAIAYGAVTAFAAVAIAAGPALPRSRPIPP